MCYEVRFVQDSELPEGVDYAFAKAGGCTYLFMKQSARGGGAAAEWRALGRAFATWERAHSVEFKQLAGAL